MSTPNHRSRENARRQTALSSPNPWPNYQPGKHLDGSDVSAKLLYKIFNSGFVGKYTTIEGWHSDSDALQLLIRHNLPAMNQPPGWWPSLSARPIGDESVALLQKNVGRILLNYSRLTDSQPTAPERAQPMVKSFIGDAKMVLKRAVEVEALVIKNQDELTRYRKLISDAPTRNQAEIMKGKVDTYNASLYKLLDYNEALGGMLKDVVARYSERPNPVVQYDAWQKRLQEEKDKGGRSI